MAVFAAFIEQHFEEVLVPYLELVRHRIARYASADPLTFPENTRRMIHLLPVAAREPEHPDVLAFVDTLVHERLPAGFELTDILEAMCYYKDVVLDVAWRAEDDPARRREILEAVDRAIRSIAVRFARAFLDLQLHLMERQREAMLELSTPVIKVWDGILALPLIGTIDSWRARQIMEELLRSVAAERAAMVLIDITGVPVVDTNVADHLIKTFRAAELLGTECLLVGVGPELAQTIVSLGVDLRSIDSCADMRQGLTLAFRRLGLRVVPVDPVAARH
ncbi:MAG: STAS domain-containing protein [Fimbriimonadaceae bacterium]|nr:STAS domain-containing protein [Fimbriimonadaceae bacterium]